MGQIAHIQLTCPLCGRMTNAYLPNSGTERGEDPNITCEQCGKMFPFVRGTAYIPIGFVQAIPQPPVQKQTEKWWQTWKWWSS